MDNEQLLALVVDEEIFQEDVVRVLMGNESDFQRIPRMPCRTQPFSGDQLVHEMLNGHPKRGYYHFRLQNTMFFKLEELLVSRGLLKATQFVSVREQLAFFLYAIGNGETNRNMQEEFQHSRETISRHFKNVLKAICSLSNEFIQTPGANVEVHPRVSGNRTLYPYFANAIGAIDGTHIPAHILKSEQIPFRNRKGFLSQNVMAAVSFDYTFLFVCAGWEGSARDMKVLKWCLENGEFDVPEGKYYLVDSRYANTHKFLAPYRSGRYHLGTFNQRTVERYRNAKDIFNHRHAQLRNCVEKAFGILKRRFRVLRSPIPYPFNVQSRIVIACCVIHNFIRRYQSDDVYFNKTIWSTPPELRVDDLIPSIEANNDERIRGDALRNGIASRIWNDYRNRVGFQSS